MAYQWESNPNASFRIGVQTNEDGDIAQDGDTITGTKNVTFGYVANSATLTHLLTGYEAGVSPAEYEHSGLGGVFIDFLLGGTYMQSTARKSVTYKAEEDE